MGTPSHKANLIPYLELRLGFFSYNLLHKIVVKIYEVRTQKTLATTLNWTVPSFLRRDSESLQFSLRVTVSLVCFRSSGGAVSFH